MVGHPAALRLHTGDTEDQPYAVWSGIVSHAAQISVEENGESIYTIRIVPSLWRTTQRRNFRVFQHAHCVEVVSSLLADWDIEPVLRLDGGKLPIHEYRVQYGETDFSFVSRMLEEGGVSYVLEQANKRGRETAEPEEETRQRADAREQTEEEKRLPSMQLVLADRPGLSGPRRQRPINYVGHTDNRLVEPWISKVRVGRGVRPGRFTIAGFDYRASPDLRLLTEATSGSAVEDRLEQFHYSPSAFIAEPRERSPRDRGSRIDDAAGKAAARLGLERELTAQRLVSFTTNQLDMAPGVVFQLTGHPRQELCHEAGILVVNRRIDGRVDSDWNIQIEGVMATDPFRPQLVTAKPRVMGLQSAIVVGPKGEEIYTDELGRVRVQFHWDRYGKRDERSSCWIRVSQAWAGSGYGTSHIPRIGHEVLVDFMDGDPDQPLVVGRAYNNGAKPPDALPKNKTKTTWRTSSVPGGDGYSELSFEDAAGEELVYMRAQRNMKRLVVADDEATVGGVMKTTVRKDEQRNVGGDQKIEVTGDRSVKVDGSYSTQSSSIVSQAGDGTGVSIQDGKVVISNGAASIVLDGPHVYIDAEANLRISAGRETQVHGKKVSIDARPEVFINSATYVPPEVVPLPISMRRGRGGDVEEAGSRRDRDRAPTRQPRRPGGTDEAAFSGKDYLLGVVNRSFGTNLKLPKTVRLPPELDEQLERYGRIGFKGEKVAGHLMDADTYRRMRARFERRIEAEKRRLKKLGDDVQKSFAKHSDHYGDLTKRLKARAAEERKNLSKLGDDLGEIFSGERGNFVESCKALVDVAKEQAAHLKQLRKDIKATIDREVAYFEKIKREAKHYVNEVKDIAEDLSNLIDNPKDALIDIVIGEDKQMAEDIASLADEFGAGDEVRDFLGLDGDEAGGGRPGGDLPGGDSPGRRPRLPRGVEAGRSPGHMNDGKQLGRVRRRRMKTIEKERGTLGKERPTRFRKMSTTEGGGIGGDQNKMSSGTVGPRGAGRAPNAMSAGGGKAMGRSPAHAMTGNASAGGKSAGRAFDGYGGEALAKRGGLGPNDFASTVKQDGPAFLQSPGDGQLMVVPEPGAKAIDPGAMRATMAQAQMTGQPVSKAVADSLGQQGYSVYTREYGDYTSAFIQTAEAAAAQA